MTEPLTLWSGSTPLYDSTVPTGGDTGQISAMSPGHPDRSRLKQIGCAVLVLIGLAVFVPRSVASAGIPEGVWLIDNEAAVQIFDCRNLCVAGSCGCRFHTILRVG